MQVAFVRLLSIVLLLVACLDAPAQRQYLIPNVQRDTVVDEDGLKQWAEFQAPGCPECKGMKVVKCPHCEGLERNEKCIECDMKKQAPCPGCAGEGNLPDPLEKIVCPMCYGEACLNCDRCGNEGSIPLQGGGDKPSKCPCCKGEGGYECTVCRGDRQVEAFRMRPSVGEAELEDLREVRAEVEKAKASLEAFSATGDWRDDVEAYEEIIEPLERHIPAFKKCGPAVTELLKRIGKLPNYTGDKEAKQRALDRIVLFHKAHLTMQLQTLDLCIARQEHNEKVLAEKEKKDE